MIRYLLIIFFVFFGSQTSYAWRMEAGQVTTNDTAVTPSFTNVTFQHAFDVIPIVVVLPTTEGPDPTTLRIDNVSLTGFDVSPIEADGSNGSPPAMTIHYVAIEPGSHTFADGTIIEANTHSTTTVQGRNVGATGYDTVAFERALKSTASVVATIQTMNSEDNAVPVASSRPFMTVATRLPSAASIQLALDRAETTAGTVDQESIGWIAFPSGNGGNFIDNLNNVIGWEARLSDDNIVGFNICRTNVFTSFTWPNARVFASKNRRDGGDGGWLRRCSLTSTSIGLVIDEDLSNDSERNHTTESAGLLAFSDSFHAEFTGVIDANKEVSIATGTYALPGNSVRYKISAQSIGNMAIDPDAIVLVDNIPPNVELKVIDIGVPGGGPVNFIEESPASTLTYTFNGLSDLSDDVDFSNDGGATFTYVPTAGGNGADPLVTAIRISPKGTFPAASAAGQPSFSVEFDAVIK